MSGIEIAGIAFGVLPILIEVVKSYSNVCKQVHTLRHYSKEVKSISEQLKVHNGIFLNEVRLLLRSIEAEEEVESMLEDAVDQRWISKHLNDKLRTVLRDSFDVCHGIIEETRDTIETMREEIGNFDVLLNQKTKGESIKSTLKRLGGAIKITFDKSRHDRCLANLRDRNGDLSALRSQVSALQRQDAHGTSACVQHKPLPRGLNSIQNASQKLHEAICGAWCCDDPTHRGHYAKLCIDAQVQAEVRLDLAISCHEPSPNGNNNSSPTRPIWFYVQSISTSRDAAGQQANTTSSPDNPAPSPPLELLTSCVVNVLKKKASSDLQHQSSCRKKAKSVYFVDASTASDPVAAVSKPPFQALAPDIDLCQTKDICKYLQRHYHLSGQTVAKRCIGYLETPQMYKHLFYFRDENRAVTPGPIRTQLDSVCSIFDVMRHNADDALAVEDQLKLAHKTALALLQFNDTPWLPDRWRLRDLSYFGSKSSLNDEALKTLHLSSQISAPAVANALDNTMNGIEQAADVVSDQDRYGINNTTLFFLGIALLEIAHWKPIEEKMTDRDLNNEIFAARRLAAGRAPLGPQYQKIAEKCLQCNFGFGTKLGNKGLQTAVYNDVVCELENMIEKLTV
ncbi:hypothetical protein BU25DRAFT_456615 [Macroventuria anomochaeta]|uniref:Uncharacterized protein n=1 Tax=Macroventuria anomochaeta TaxID=301207 RepID=A0ACB6S7M4_9PLEO|nr:uncharacterized protein BU25DRAFT_456615 [Macroventuria anomochaeta]KAF2629517.1 hypothetical protein BU25DRAFT_456615 [Macroventuria anomochaeta]